MSGLSKAACLGRLQLGVRAHRGFHCLVTSPLELPALGCLIS